MVRCGRLSSECSYANSIVEVLTHILSHLPAPSLSAMSMVSRRFHELVITPHAWRFAFSRYFPGPACLGNESDIEKLEYILSSRRSFSRLTALASWRSEYILRTRLLRSLSRGKPGQYHQFASQPGISSRIFSHGMSAVTTYSSHCRYPITHMDGTFSSPTSQKPPMFIHGSSELGIVSTSDPTSGGAPIGTLGLSDPQLFQHFEFFFPGEEQWGLGSGNMVGVPNVMDVSKLHGVVYGEGSPQGRAYFLSSNEKRGRFLSVADTDTDSTLGIPNINIAGGVVCSVWIAKSQDVVSTTNGIFGILVGYSTGVIASHALGPYPTYDQRYERGQVTAKWVLCPGVPIVEIKIDDNYSPKRHSQRRVWATVLNALGEVYYLTDLPAQPECKAKLNPREMDRLAWLTGKSVRWELLQATERVPRSDPFNNFRIDARYNPRSSSNSMEIDSSQLVEETREIQNSLLLKPNHFRKVCQGWDMKRKMEVDFAGDDHNDAGESIILMGPGGADQSPSIRRFTRVRSIDPSGKAYNSANISKGIGFRQPSIFGSVESGSPLVQMEVGSSQSSSQMDKSLPSISTASADWRQSEFVMNSSKESQITCNALDNSTFSQITLTEDPLVTMCGESTPSSQFSTPTSQSSEPLSPSQIPGQRARFFAIGTSTGSVFIWNARAPVSPASGLSNTIAPLRVINTDSPQVSCVALTSLYLVHGGNDGLVQAWDPLASSTSPIRTLNSRFSSRARRRIQQAEVTPQGVGENFFAAGTICLDPDPTILRGIVSIGGHLRYWSYSSSTADQYKSNKRRFRHLQRNHGRSTEDQRSTGSGRGTLRDFIADEKYELERQNFIDQKEREHLSGRFGVDLLGSDATEEELLAYASMLSEESYTSDERKRTGSGDGLSSRSSPTVAPNSKLASSSNLSLKAPPIPVESSDSDPDLAEAIRLSLQEASHDPFEFTSLNNSEMTVFPVQGPPSPILPGSSRKQEDDDLELALQLSMAEQEAQGKHSEISPAETFPPLESTSSSKSKDKGKARA